MTLFRIVVYTLTAIDLILAILNPYAVTPMVLGKFPIYLAVFIAGMVLAKALDSTEPK